MPTAVWVAAEHPEMLLSVSKAKLLPHSIFKDFFHITLDDTNSTTGTILINTDSHRDA